MLSNCKWIILSSSDLNNSDRKLNYSQINLKHSENEISQAKHNKIENNANETEIDPTN